MYWLIFIACMVAALLNFMNAYNIYTESHNETLRLFGKIVQGITWIGFSFLFSMQDFFKKGTARRVAVCFSVVMLLALIIPVLYRRFS